MENPFEIIQKELAEIKALIKELDAKFDKKEYNPTNPATIEREGYVNAKDVANHLGVHLITVHTWKEKGIIPSHRIGTKIKYRLSEIDAAMKSKKHKK